MQTRMKVEKPEDIVYTMTITMSAGNWEKLREQLGESRLSSSYPAWNLRSEIDDLLGQARKVYWPIQPSEVGNG